MRVRNGFRFALALLVVSAGSFATANGDVTRFQGQVSGGGEFRKPIGHGLIFILDPGSGGWIIRIAPNSSMGPACATDFAWVVNMPVRNYNDLYLNPTYGFTAQQAVDRSPREFNFVLNCAGYKRESTFLERLTGSLPVGAAPPSAKELADAQANLGTSPQGRGKLWIEKYKISAAPQDVQGKNYGQIDWIRFRVEIRFPDVAGTLTK